MAVVKNGLLSGRIGDLVFKIRNGKQIACKAPDHYTKPDTPEYKERISRFSFCASLNASVNSVRIFKEYWEKSKITGKTNLNKLLKFNLSGIKPGFDISSIQLVDSGGYPNLRNDINFFNSGLTVTYYLNNFPSLTEFSSVQGVILLKNPIDPLSKQYKFINFSSIEYAVVKDENQIYNVEFSSQDIEFIKAYNSVCILINIAFRKKEGYVIGFSETEYIEL